MPDFTFDQRLNNGVGAYRGANGRIISQAQVREALDGYVDASQNVSRDLGILLRDGNISLADWQLQMRAHIKDVHLAAAAAQRGGWQNMTQADFGRVGQRIREQYRYLDNFAKQIADGTQPLDGRFLVRSQMYTDAAVATYDRFETNAFNNAGFDEERSILEPGARHCGECESEAARGWQPLGSIKPIGERTCLTRCRCTKEYRNSLTGETVQ